MSGKLPFGHFASIATVGLLVFFILPEAMADARDAAAEAEARESTTQYYDDGGRARTSLRALTEDRFEALATEGPREKPGRAAVNSGKTASAAKGSEDFWFYYADVELFSDDDHDGYFYGIDVLFDADTLYEVADVYAVLYLSYEGGPWNEYAATETFSIYGATSDDEYVVVTELAAGYPTGSYDLLIELYDTHDGSFVADIGPETNPDLGYLPLEDANRDDPRRDSRRHHGGGALDWLMALLPGVLVARRRLAGRYTRSSPAQARNTSIHPDFPTAATGCALPRAARITLRPHADSASK